MKLSNHLLLLVLIAPTAWCFNGVLSRKHGGRPPLNIGTNHWQPLKKASQRVGVNWSYTSLSASPAAPLSPAALGYMSLLALQFGLQPIFTRAFAPKTICRSTIVMMQEVAKLITAAILLHVSGGWNSSLAGWSIKSSSLVAGIPAALYVVQNYCSLVAYQNLTPVTFNVLNQTKTLSAALFCFLIMGRIQSKLQILSLVVLSVAALVLEKVLPLPWKIGRTQDATVAEGDDQTHFSSGVLPILAASSISGLAGVSICKRSHERDPNIALTNVHLHRL
jgi:UDP-sugar transporter A1/2/3